MNPLVHAIYFAGLAVEGILRAYRYRQDPTFDARHDLPELLRLSTMLDFVPPRKKRQVSADLGEIWSRWSNEYRYAHRDALLNALKRKKLCNSFTRNGVRVKIKGDPLKANAKIVLEAALSLVTLGESRWDCKKS